MDDILELMKTRRSIRRYKDKDVPDELLEKIMEAWTTNNPEQSKSAKLASDDATIGTRKKIEKPISQGEMNAKPSLAS